MTKIRFPWNNIFLITVALSSGILYYYSTGVAGFRLLVWIAPVPVLGCSLSKFPKLYVKQRATLVSQGRPYDWIKDD